MQAAAIAERERVEAELDRVRERLDDLVEEIDGVRATRSALEDELALLRRLSRSAADEPSTPSGDVRRLRVVPNASQSSKDVNAIVLRGAQIRETAVRTLAATAQADQAVHYRTWFELVRQAGFIPAGKDPLASFLTQIARSPVVKRSTAPGVYSLDLDVPAREHAKLARLQRELDELDQTPPSGDLDEINQLRERRARITADATQVERRLVEAERSLDARGI
jgi:hypothetical protein